MTEQNPPYERRCVRCGQVRPRTEARCPRCGETRYEVIYPEAGTPRPGLHSEIIILLHIDVGFDLRITKDTAHLSTLPVRYMRRIDGRDQPLCTSADWEAAVTELTLAGYRVAEKNL